MTEDDLKKIEGDIDALRDQFSEIRDDVMAEYYKR